MSSNLTGGTFRKEEMRLIHIKRRKTKEVIEAEARLLLEGLIHDEGDDDVLDKAIEIAHKEGRDVKFMRGEAELNPESAYGIRYFSGYDIR